MSIPIFICNRNLLTWPKNAVEWFNKIPDLRPIIIDNDSTYQPLLEWYKNCPCEVKYHKTNGGPFVAWTGYVDETVKGNKQPLYAVMITTRPVPSWALTPISQNGSPTRQMLC